jgi:hypothetical protein
VLCACNDDSAEVWGLELKLESRRSAVLEPRAGVGDRASVGSENLLLALELVLEWGLE